MKKTFRFKLYSSIKNKHLHNLIDIAAEIHNYCISVYREHYVLYKKHLKKYDLQKHLTQVKCQSDKKHWDTLGSQAIQNITDRIDLAYKHFFQSLQKQKKTSPPRFRKRKKYKSFTLKQAGYKVLDGNKVRIGNKVYKFHKSREVEGKIKTVTIKRDSLGDIFIYFTCEVLDPQSEKQVTMGKIGGFDFGLKTFLTGSDGTEFMAPLFLKKGLNKLKKLYVKFSSKEEGSNNQRKAQLDIARAHRKIAFQREDFHYKLANLLVKKYGVLCFETLNIAAMKRLWGRKVSDLGFAHFLEILKHQCFKAGIKINFIPQFYPSSKQCHNCLYIKEDLALSDREWQCNNCHIFHKRDLNASKNIERVGTSTLGLGNVRPTMAIAV